MNSVDDRFLSLLADNCKNLQNVNFNGCRWVSDKGMAALARFSPFECGLWFFRNCNLREIRIRGTGCTDKSLYSLAQFCPEMQWIAHADFSGRPKFSSEALQFLRNACIQRVICWVLWVYLLGVKWLNYPNALLIKDESTSLLCLKRNKLYET